MTKKFEPPKTPVERPIRSPSVPAYDHGIRKINEGGREIQNDRRLIVSERVPAPEQPPKKPTI